LLIHNIIMSPPARTPVHTDISTIWQRRIVILSVLLLFFAIPHTLEDFAGGEPARAGVPELALATVISTLVAAQALALYGLGRGARWSSLIHIGVGVFWPIAAGIAQLPVILTTAPYRSGAISVAYVLGMIVTGALLGLAAILSLVKRQA
jgi:hypothetical protein